MPIYLRDSTRLLLQISVSIVVTVTVADTDSAGKCSRGSGVSATTASNSLENRHGFGRFNSSSASAAYALSSVLSTRVQLPLVLRHVLYVALNTGPWSASYVSRCGRADLPTRPEKAAQLDVELVYTATIIFFVVVVDISLDVSNIPVASEVGADVVVCLL